jgi:CheY-like chemotaxis protein
MMAGWEVFSAASGQQALVDAAREQPDVILLDVMMPGMDGPTTARRLREEPRTAGIPVILLTAKVQSSDGRPYSDLAVAGVISKPFDPISLADQVTRILEAS